MNHNSKNSKSEFRNTKQYQNTKSECSKTLSREFVLSLKQKTRMLFWILNFGNSDLFRISNLDIRIWAERG